MFYVKIHEGLGDVMVAVCDREILGKRYEEGRLQIEVSERFYKGSVVGEEEMVGHLSSSTIANIVGNRAVDAAIKHGFIEEESVILIGGVKHAQIIHML